MTNIKKMTPLSAKTEIEKLLSFFTQKGYLFIKGLFSKSLIKSIREAVCAVLSQEGIISGKAPLDAIPMAPAYRINSPLFYHITERVISQELIHSLAYNDCLLSLLSSLLGKKLYPHPNKMFRVCYPYHMNPYDVTPPHQDVYYIKGEKDTFTVWTPLGDYKLKEGGLQVLEESHKGGLYPIRGEHEKQFRCAAAHVSFENPRWRVADYEMGDCLVMHSLTVHASGQNLGNSLRMSIDCRFSAINGEINQEQLNVPYHNYVKGWEKIMRGWKQKWPLKDIPSQLIVLPKETPLERTLKKLSIFLESSQ